MRRSGRRFSHRYHYSISICKRQRLKQDLCKKPKIRFDFWQSKRPSRSGRAGKPWENLLLVRGFLFVILILVVIIRLGLIENAAEEDADKVQQAHGHSDLGGTTAKVGLFTTAGALLEKWEVPTDTSNAGEHILGNLAKAVKDKMQENGITAEQVEGVGVGVPGPVLDSRIVPIVCANLGGWGERNVSIQLSGLLDGIKVLVGNDANVAALGEIWMGCAKGCRSAVMVTLGTGVGGGVIVNGRIIEGAHGAGGEIGHITVNPHETAVCGCGKHGCLEQYSSATGVVRCMKKLLDENPDTPCTLRGTDFAAKDVFDAARAGDALAAREVDEMTDTLGMALASIASTTDPEMFMVGGGVARAGDVLFNPLREHFKTYAFSSCRETPIVAATLGNDAGIYGAVRLIVGE